MELPSIAATEESVRGDGSRRVLATARNVGYAGQVLTITAPSYVVETRSYASQLISSLQTA